MSIHAPLVPSSVSRSTALSLAIALSTLISLPARAAEEAAAAPSAEKIVVVCQSCHGEHGAKPITPDYPVLAGQYANYIEHALKDYRSGVRKNPVMKAQAANLSDADIKAVAQYFEHQESPLYTFALPPSSAAKAP